MLAVDTCSSSVSVCVQQDDKVIGEYFLNAGLTHSETVMVMVQNLLETAKISVRDVDLFAVTNGPGSFTGLRIGLAAVKGMASVLGKPCVAVSSLYAAALNVGNNFDNNEVVVCSCIESRAGQSYNALFMCKNGNLNRITQDRSILIQELISELQKYPNIVFVGDGASTCYNAVNEFAGPPKKFIMMPENLRFIRASNISKCALDKYSKGEAVTACDLMPNYLKLSQAERNLIKNKKTKNHT